MITHISKQDRVTRHFEGDFGAESGQWAELLDDGSLRNVVTGTPAPVHKMIWSGVSRNPYESNDSRLGSVTTIEAVGAKVVVDRGSFVGSPEVADLLGVGVLPGSEGKMFSMRENPGSASGGYEAVAMVEAVDTETITIKTLPYSMVTLPIGEEPASSFSTMYLLSMMSQDLGS